MSRERTLVDTEAKIQLTGKNRPGHNVQGIYIYKYICIADTYT